jgi:hypothetical protein
MSTDTPLNGGSNKANSQRFGVIITLNAIAEKDIPKQSTGKNANQGNQAFHTAYQQ